jgi:streptomycin 6-kinase
VTPEPVRIPQRLRCAVAEDDDPARIEWLQELPRVVDELALELGLELGAPFTPGGQCAWVAPARKGQREDLVLKVGWRHHEAEHEADALRFWDGDGTIRCLAARTRRDTIALLLERCVPGDQLKQSRSEPEQDVVIVGLLRRLWRRPPGPDHPFATLTDMCDRWAAAFEAELDSDSRGLDRGLGREGIAALRELPRTSERGLLLCTDLHAGNVLASQREPWLVIDPKPFIGDPAYDVVQHMLNCDERLALDPAVLAARMADLLELDRERVTQWLFARCVQEALYDCTMREPAKRLAP